METARLGKISQTWLKGFHEVVFQTHPRRGISQKCPENTNNKTRKWKEPLCEGNPLDLTCVTASWYYPVRCWWTSAYPACSLHIQTPAVWCTYIFIWHFPCSSVGVCWFAFKTSDWGGDEDERSLRRWVRPRSVFVLVSILCCCFPLPSFPL